MFETKKIHFTYFTMSTKFLVLFFTVLLYSCNQIPDSNAELTKENVEKAIPSVCIWDDISVREEPVRSSSIISRLNLGETVSFLGLKAIDSTYKNQEYLKIKLSDGQIVWAYNFSLVIHAKSAVVKEEVPVYMRPDLLTISDKKLSAMDIVAITDEIDNWVKYISEKKNNEGWIQKDKISYVKEDIAFSLIAGRKLKKNSNELLLEKIEYILANNPYPNSYFVPVLKDIARQEREKMKLEEAMKENWQNNWH